MNFNSIKERFLEYINSNSDNKLVRGNFELRTQLIRKGSVDNVSLFSNMDLFKEFLKAEYNYTPKEKTATMSIEDIVKNMEIVDNQLVEVNEDGEVSEKSNEENEIEDNENTDTKDLSDKDKKEELNDTDFIKGIINELLQDKDFISKYDTSGNNAIDIKELTKYLKEISTADDNGKDISIQDLIEGKAKKEKKEKAQKPTFGDIIDKAEETFDNIKEGVKEKAGNFFSGVKNAASNFAQNLGFSSGGSGAVSNYTAPSKHNSDGSLNLDNLNLEELQKAKSDEQTKFQEKQESLNELYSDGGELQGSKEKVDNMLESYNEKLEETDSKLASQIKEKQSQIAEKESAISAKEAEITAQEATIAESKNNVSNIEQSITNLESAKSTLSTATSSMGDDKQAEAQAKLSNLNTEIENKKQELEQAKAQQQEAEEKLEQLKTGEGGLSQLQEELEQLNGNEEGQLGYLQEQIAQKYPDAAPALEQMYEQYQEAKNIYETETKPQAIETAKAEVTKSQEEINKINTKIEECKTNETKQENTVYSSTLPDDVAKALDEKLGSGFTNRLQEVCENLKCNPEDLVGLMYSESGLNPAAVNKSSGATGLIQFIKSTARGLGTTTDELKNMSAIQQLTFVEKYLQNCKNGAGLSSNEELSAGDLYTLVFLPGRIKGEVITARGEIYYNSNTGLDLDSSGQITKTDLTKQVKRKYNSFLKTI